MTRILIAGVLTTVFATGTAAAYQTAPPPTQTKPPAQTTPPPATPPSLLPTAPQKPAAPVVPFPAEAKIGFVNLGVVVTESKLGKLGQAQMKDFTDRMTGELTAKQKEVDNLTRDIQQGQGVMSDNALATKRSLLAQKSRELQYSQDDWDAKGKEFNENLLGGFSEKVVPIVEELRQEKGLWVIFAVQNADGGLAVLAANPGLDLSNEVVKRVDLKYPGSGK